MGAIELQIARYADEQGRKDALDEQTETAWLEAREDLAEQLANDQALKLNGRILLTFEDVENWLFERRPEEMRQAMILCVANHGLGGKHMKRLIEEAAQAVVDNYADNFKQEIQNDIEKGEAA